MPSDRSAAGILGDMKGAFLLVVGLSLSGAILVSGCRKPDSVASGPSDRVQFSEDGKTMTFVDPQGKKTVVTMEGEGGPIRVKTDEGERTFDPDVTVSEDDLGLPFYPGSEQKPHALSKVETADGKMVVTVRLTDDEPERVVEFYRPLLRDAVLTNVDDSDNRRQILTGKTERGHDAVIGITRPPGAKKTEINLSVTSPKSPETAGG